MQESEAKKYVKWDDKYQTLIYRNLTGLLASIHVQASPDGSLSVGIRQAFEASAYQHVLAAVVNMEDIPSNKVKRSLILHAAAEVKKGNVQDVTSFRCHLADLVKKQLERPTDRYDILMSLNVEPESFAKRRSFSICGVKITVHGWHHIHKRYDTKAMYKRADEYLTIHDLGNIRSAHSSVPLVCSVSGRDINEALGIAEMAFNRFRTLLNYVEQSSTYRQQFGGLPKALAKYPPPHLYGIFKQDGKFKDIALNDDPPLRYKTESMYPQSLEVVGNLLHFFKQPKDKHDVMSVIIEAFDQYGRAVDTPIWQTAFLSLWQSLEIITYRGTDKFNTENQVRRLDALMFHNPLFADLLRVAHDDRNEYVHRGIFPDSGMDDVGMLKMIVELCLANLTVLYKTYPTWARLEVVYTSFCK